MKGDNQLHCCVLQELDDGLFWKSNIWQYRLVPYYTKPHYFIHWKSNLWQYRLVSYYTKPDYFIHWNEKCWSFINISIIPSVFSLKAHKNVRLFTNFQSAIFGKQSILKIIPYIVSTAYCRPSISNLVRTLTRSFCHLHIVIHVWRFCEWLTRELLDGKLKRILWIMPKINIYKKILLHYKNGNQS